MNSQPVYEAIWARKRAAGGEIVAGTRGAVALELIGSGERVLDVGCGAGELGAALATRYAQVYGVDVSAHAVELARQRGLHAMQVNLDNKPLPFEDGMFSAVTCLDVIEHVFDPRVLAREIARVCAPQATVVITTPNLRYWRHILSIISGRFPRTSADEEGYDGGHLHYFTARNHSDLLSDWFTVRKVQGVPGGPRRGIGACLLRVALPGRVGDELASPGIAICAIRR